MNAKLLLSDHRRTSVRALWVATILCLSCHAPRPKTLPESQTPPAPIGAPTVVIQDHAANEKLAGSDPLSFLRRCRRNYFIHVRDYRCLFTKMERIEDRLTPEQKTEVAFRESPYSVLMNWVVNPGRARRVSYVAGRWNEGGHERALVQLDGMANLFAPLGIKLDIHGSLMRSESRRPVDQFGFERTLESIIEACERFQQHREYRLTYEGTALLADRPCYLFERRLPYNGSDELGPSRVLLVYIDREWLVPTGCFSYADDALEVLLGSYLLTDVRFNVGLTDADF